MIQSFIKIQFCSAAFLLLTFTNSSAEITLTSTIDIGIQVESLAISSDNQFLFASGWRGDTWDSPHFQVFNISNPTSPFLVGSMSTPTDRGSISYITLSNSGNKAYLSSVLDGIIIVDILNPQAPTLDGSYLPGFNSTHRVSLSNDDNTAYLGAGDYGFQTIDVSNSSSPQLISTLDTTTNCTINGQPVFSGNCAAGNIAISNDGNTAFVPSSWNGLKVVDITNPDTLIELETISGTGDTNTFANVQLSDDGTLAYALGGNGLSIFDITDLSNISLTGMYDDNAIFGNNFSISDNGELIYFATSNNGIQVIDVSDSTNPFKSDEFYQIINQTAPNALDIALFEESGYAYVAAGGNGLQIIDISSVPIPQAFWLFGSGLIGLIGVARRKRSIAV